MAKTNTRLWRLEKLTADLKQDAPQTLKQLAELHGVSERTIARDVRLLRQRGVPIDADRGKGGGTRISHSWGVGRLKLNDTEAVELMISMAIAEQMDSPLFLSNLAAIKRQLEATLAPETRRRVSGLKSRILVGKTASSDVQTGISAINLPIQQALQASFIDQKSLFIQYKAEGGQISQRVIEPNLILLNYPSWYVLAYDQLRKAPRTFRCDRIMAAQLNPDTFKLRHSAYFNEILQWNASLK